MAGRCTLLVACLVAALGGAAAQPPAYLGRFQCPLPRAPLSLSAAVLEEGSVRLTWAAPPPPPAGIAACASPLSYQVTIREGDASQKTFTTNVS